MEIRVPVAEIECYTCEGVSSIHIHTHTDDGEPLYIYGTDLSGQLEWEIIPSNKVSNLLARDRAIGEQADAHEMLQQCAVPVDEDNRAIIRLDEIMDPMDTIASLETTANPLRPITVEESPVMIPPRNMRTSTRYSRFLRSADPDFEMMETRNYVAETELILSWEGPGYYELLPLHTTRYTRRFLLSRRENVAPADTNRFIHLEAYPYRLSCTLPFSFYVSDITHAGCCLRDGDIARVVFWCGWEGPGTYAVYYNPLTRRWGLRNMAEVEGMESQVSITDYVEVNHMPGNIELRVDFEFGFDRSETYAYSEGCAL
ncbi:MAG: hypothetical protein RMJ43_11755 [Chloroherpetonaceae bacterium]|nr:hypothetical protein [Chthonomonadaceae bacterium]MDW8208503.1 hypothetical protein [Chloroherpetonaceae bacterium]